MVEERTQGNPSRSQVISEIQSACVAIESYEGSEDDSAFAFALGADD